MPGVIKQVAVQAGQQVQSGQLLVVLEAMKMENEIVAPKAGTVTAVLVTPGQTVNPGAPLVNLR
jgi:biotin carboxyl carrier protein